MKIANNKKRLTAVAVDAGLYPHDFTPYGSLHQKGGWIILRWQRDIGSEITTDRRIIQVSRERALQAIFALARHPDTIHSI